MGRSFNGICLSGRSLRSTVLSGQAGSLIRRHLQPTRRRVCYSDFGVKRLADFLPNAFKRAIRLVSVISCYFNYVVKAVKELCLVVSLKNNGRRCDGCRHRKRLSNGCDYFGVIFSVQRGGRAVNSVSIGVSVPTKGFRGREESPNSVRYLPNRAKGCLTSKRSLQRAKDVGLHAAVKSGFGRPILIEGMISVLPKPSVSEGHLVCQEAVICPKESNGRQRPLTPISLVGRIYEPAYYFFLISLLGLMGITSLFCGVVTFLA